jgi:predicted PurR-regulated permease PerM
MAAWGFTGMFIGAVTMAVFWTSIQVWAEGESMSA